MKISVCIATYNHELYIRECLEGVVSQQLNCSWEVVLGEDHSTDNTLAICQEYAEKYPDIIKLLYAPVNLGMMKNAMRTLGASSGEYIAICEGDDFWTDPLKLQRQLDFLEANPEYSMIAENGLIRNSVQNQEAPFNTIAACDLEITDLLRKRQFPSASVLFRSRYLKENFKQPKYGGDTFLWVYLATRGKVRYLPNISSVYRRGMQGVVLSTGRMEWAQLMENWNEEIARIVPENFDQNIFKRRNYSTYMKVFYDSAKLRDRKNALQALKKCFHYQPLRTTLTLSSYLLKGLKRNESIMSVPVVQRND